MNIEIVLCRIVFFCTLQVITSNDKYLHFLYYLYLFNSELTEYDSSLLFSII